MKEPNKQKQHWQKAMDRQKDASNLLSDRLRTQRRVIEAQAKEIEEMRAAWPQKHLAALEAITAPPVTIKELAESA